MKKRIKSELELKLDDDGKLRRKYINKCHNAIKEGLCVELTFEEFMQLMIIANIVSSDLGFSGGKNYVLARISDKGNYTFSNCRFITQLENVHERSNVYLKQYSCIECGCKISKYSKRCTSCEQIRRSICGTSSRKMMASEYELRNLIQTKTLTEIGNLYGISETAVRKWLSKYNIKNPRGFNHIK